MTLTDTRDYGRLIAASLGEEWSGFGQALFVRPVEQSWRQVLTPAADSLNRQWQRAIVSHWNQDFAGRYPFKASQNDASLPCWHSICAMTGASTSLSPPTFPVF